MMTNLGTEIVMLRLDGEDNKKGFVQVDATNGTIQSITVFDENNGAEENYRRKGYGRKLVHLAEDYLLSKGFKTVKLQALRQARPFWEKLGYTSVTRDENYTRDIEDSHDS